MAIHGLRMKECGRGAWCWGIGALVICAATWAYAGVRYGSFGIALSVLRGDPIAISPAIVDLGTLSAREERTVRVQISNLTADEIRLVGSQGSCSCMTVDGFPRKISGGGHCEMSIQIRAIGKRPEVVQRMTFYTNHREAPAIATEIRYRMASAGLSEDPHDSQTHLTVHTDD
jgi:hypothetical protein